MTRAEVMAMPNVAMASAMVFDNDDDEDDASALAWAWIRGEGQHPRTLGLGARSVVRVCSSRMSWVDVSP